MTSSNQILEKFDNFDAKLRELSIRENEAAFAMYRGLEHEDLDKIEAETSALWNEPDTREISDSRAPSPETERPFQLIRHGVLRNRVEGIEEIFKAKNLCNKMIVKFKPEIDGKPISRSDLGELVRWDPDPVKRRSAASAFIPLEEQLHDKVLDVVNKRNKAAKELGFESYPHLTFELNELDLDEVRGHLELFLDRSAVEYSALLDEHRDRPEMTSGGLLTSDLAFLHENYLPNLPKEKFPSDNLLDVLKGEYLSVGIDLDKLPIETVIQDIPAGGFCFTFDPGRDTRILANPRDGQMWYQILFHEFGHALQGSTTVGDGHYLVALGDPGFFWEGIAVLFEKLAMRNRFLSAYVDDESEIDAFRNGAKKRLAFRIRRLALDALFEYSLYLDPASYEELRKRKADMIRKHYMVEPAVDPPSFTHDIFHITHPCYIQNYVLAEMVAAQLLESSDSNTSDPWTETFADKVIVDLLVPGAMLSWQDKIEKFTGKPLGPEAILSELG